MPIRRLERDQWKEFFDHVAGGRYATIELASPQLGLQVQASAVLMEGITYEPRSDVLAILCQGLEHVVHKPEEVYVDTVLGELSSLAVRNEEGEVQIITLRRLRALPPPRPNA